MYSIHYIITSYPLSPLFDAIVLQQYFAIVIDVGGRLVLNEKWFNLDAEDFEAAATPNVTMAWTQDNELSFNQFDWDAFLPVSGYTYKKGAVARFKAIGVKYGWGCFKEDNDAKSAGEAVAESSTTTKKPAEKKTTAKAANVKVKAKAAPKKTAVKRNAATMNDAETVDVSGSEKKKKAPVRKPKAKKEAVTEEEEAVKQEDNVESEHA